MMEQLIEQMKVILGTNFGLYFKAHNFHWNVEGPNFAEYHGFLGNFYEAVFDQTDSIAEHIRALGSYTPTSLGRMMELSKVVDLVAIPSPLIMMSELANDNDKFIMELRAGIALADAADEPAVGNFLQDILDAHQKHGWMLKSFTR
jgi:starvation-inducible DNA-binding protein